MHNEKEAKRLIASHHIQRSVTNGLNVMNLITGEVHFTTDGKGRYLASKCDDIM